MNLKKLSVAAALSIGVMTISSIAIADQLGEVCPPPRAVMEKPCPTGAAYPVCPPLQQVIPQQPAVVGAACPVCPPPQVISNPQQVFSPSLMPAAAPAGCAMAAQPIAGCTPDATAGADILERQAYAFPDIGDAGLVIPKGDGLLQIGGDEEAMAVSSTCPSGLTTYPSYGPVLNLMSKDDPEFSFNSGAIAAYPGMTGAAAPCAPCAPACHNLTGSATPCIPSGIVGAAAPCPTAYPCPQCGPAPMERVTQGVEIFRCGIPEQQTILQVYYNSPCFREAGILGAAVPITPCPQPCNPCVPVNPCDPCQPCPTGGAAPLIPMINPCDPCNPCVPAVPLSSADSEENIVPCSYGEEEKIASAEVPCDYIEPCPTGAAAPVSPPPPLCPPPCQPVPVCPEPCPTGAAVPVCPTTCAPAAPCAQPVGGRRIQTSSGIQTQKSVLVPVQVPVVIPEQTGAACPVMSQYPDVSNQMTSGCDINKLTAQGILAGYPDRTYKPNLPIMRDEFASAMVSALEIENVPDFAQQIFRDVPKNHWANADIDKAYNRGLMTGYPDNSFKPDNPVSRVEALSTMGKVLPGSIAAGDAQKVLGCYTDANEIPGWAAISVAEALNAGLIKNLPGSDQVRPNDSASRAEVASMLDELRQVLGLEPTPQTTGAATQLQPGIATSTIPTLKVQFEDIISARTSTTGDEFVAKTVEPISIDGQLFPVGSEVHGEVVEVIRPGFGEAGAIRVAFDELRYECDGDNRVSTALPRDILSAVVVREDAPNIIGRIIAWPFSWPGKVAGVAGRTVGGSVITASNMVENFLTNIANGNNELANLEPAATGRSYLTAAGELAEGVWFTGKTIASGTLGVVKVTGDELAYIVSPDGDRIAQINPDEVLSVAFGAK